MLDGGAFRDVREAGAAQRHRAALRLAPLGVERAEKVGTEGNQPVIHAFGLSLTLSIPFILYFRF